MLHHEYDALTGYRVLGGAISFYSVSCMSDVIFNPSLLNWSSLILTVAHMLNATQLVWDGWGGGMITFLWTLGTQKIDRLWQDLKGLLGRSVSSKNNAREVNPRLKTYVYAYMFRRNADNVWHETGQLCKG